MTKISDALRDAARVLKSAGIDGAERDARKLLAAALGLEPAKVTMALQDNMPEGAEAAFAGLVARRAKRVPVSHILGYRDFWKSRFKVTPDVLDPRPETELLVEIALRKPFDRALDLGTGSGAILVSLLLERPGATGVGTDISDRAILVAGENARALGVAERITLPLSDWFDDVGSRYDLIVSNPPYIAAWEMAGLDEEVRLFEPTAALTDGDDGLAAYRKIAGKALNHLNPGGRILVEIGASQAEAVVALFRDAGFTFVEVFQDLDGRNRVVQATVVA